MKGLVIEAMSVEDWPEVHAIYEEGIRTGVATLETEVPDRESWDAGHRANCRLVARSAGKIVGWAALSPVSRRPVYAGVAEVSVYVSEAARGLGAGKALLTELVRASEADGVWTLEAKIFPENEASLALHQTCGFRIVGRRERLGRLADRWHDILLLERRA